MQVVLATGNTGKLREFSSMLGPAGFEFVPQSALGIEGVEETGSTFFENAWLKARHAAARSGLPALADDSGLEVDALGGAPGVFSARYAGAGATDQQNLRKLLTALQTVPMEARTARFCCVLVWLRRADDEPIVGTGVWSGRILRRPRGRGGFGYDPIFQPALGAGSGYHEHSAAQLAPEQKQAQSHRALALMELRRRLAARP